MDELFEKIQKLIVEKLDIDASKVTMEASFRNDLGADSLDTYELVYAIEEELGVSIPDERANEFETVRDAYEFIKAEQNK
jgi:acyl carrier protein